MNVLNFGGGGFAGTAYMLGSLLAFDQVLVVPELGFRERKVFFDYADDVGVLFGKLENNVDEVMQRIPGNVRSGLEDVVGNTFSLAQGISGGSLLAWGVLGRAPLMQLVKSMLLFDARVYFKPNIDEYVDCATSLPLMSAKIFGAQLKAAVRMLGLPFSKKGKGDYFFRVCSDLLFDIGRSMKEPLPSGFFCGEGLEDFIVELAQEQLKLPNGDRLPLSFDELKKQDRQLVIIAERLNYVQPMEKGVLHETEVYFGLKDYDQVSIAKAIRASCSIPMLVQPMEFDDPVLGRRVQLGDGGISKTIGFRKIAEEYGLMDVWVVFNPMIPHESRIGNVVDMAEQVLRRMVYNRKCAVWDRLEPEIKERTILFEADPEFRKSLFAWPDMKEALWHGYWHGLERVQQNYASIGQKLSRAHLGLVPELLVQKYVDRNNARKEQYGC